jgi:hypothetical protein
MGSTALPLSSRGKAMRARIPSRLATVLTAAVAALAIGGLTAAPASASGTYSGLPYIQGAGDFHDDFGDEGVLSISTHTYSNATCLWQKVLWADGLLSWEDIDGIFGQKTHDATRVFQVVYTPNEPDDGSVGRKTFSAAWGLKDIDGDKTVDRYDGFEHDFTIWQDGDGRYGFYDDGVKRSAGYNYRTCS